MGGCCGEPIPTFERVFDARAARDDLRRVRKDGPGWASCQLIDRLAADGAAAGATVLDVGAGVGAIHLELLRRGAATALDVDGSQPYLETARDEAERLRLGDRVTHRLGDLVAMAPELEPADLVALDRVVCCYPDAPALLRAAASLTRHRLGLVYPKDTWWTRLGATVANPVMFRRSGGYRMFVHRSEDIDSALIGGGLARETRVDGRIWRVETWRRASDARAASPRVLATT